ncbi:MAG: heme lyase CcmF/NrfE family subunit [Acidimicrobiia bacterium]
MNASLGTAGVTLGFAASLLGAISLIVGLVTHRFKLVKVGPSYAMLAALGALVSAVAMERALITRDYEIAYVASNVANGTRPLFVFTALWGALQGSIILWSFVLSGFTLAVVRKFRTRLSDPLVGWALAVLLIIGAFFFLLQLGPANPFSLTSGAVPLDGNGPNPLLQNHILMAVHPPMLYLGYVGFTVPFSFAIAALITGRVGEGWLLATRRWTLYAWGFLTLGIVLGSWWSYEVLGWGGFWGWDPVENASFLPWLTATAYIHSVLVQERRGMLRVWNLSLVCATFSLTIFGTFLTRSGVINSVHAFANGSIGTYLLVFFGVVVVSSVGLIGWRGDELRSAGAIDSPLSREGSFLVNNLVFSAFAFVVLLGTVFPLLIEALQDRRVSVGPPFFDQMTTPLGLTLLFLMAIAPVLPWRKASGELLSKRLFWPGWLGTAALTIAVVSGADGWAPLITFFLGGFAAGAAGRQLVLATRRQGLRGLIGRANGGMIVHLGVIIIAVALAAARSYSTTAQLKLSPGESATVGGHEITYLGIRSVEEKDKAAIKADIRIDGDQVYSPAIQIFGSGSNPIPTPSVQTGVLHDVYLTLEKRPADPNGEATIRVIIMPLAVWLWIGGGVMGLGTVLAAFPGKRRNPLDPVSAPIGGRGSTGGPTPSVTDDDIAEPEPVSANV